MEKRKYILTIGIASLLLGSILFSLPGDTIKTQKDVQNTGNYSSDSTMITNSDFPIIDIDMDGTSSTISIIFSPLDITYENGYHQLTSSGCSLITEPGYPKIPQKTFYYLLPANYTISTYEISADLIEIPGSYFLESEPLPSYCIDSTIIHPEHSTNTIHMYPAEVFQENGINKFRGYRLWSLTFFTAQYSEESYTLSQVNDITIIIEFTEKPFVEPLYRGTPEDRTTVEKLVQNPSTTSTYPRTKTTSRDTYKYVIITNTNLYTEFLVLKDWKTITAGSAKIVNVSWIDTNYGGTDLPEKIRNFIIDMHTNHGTEWILLGGDIEVIPYRGCYAKVFSDGNWVIDETIPSDLYYSDLDGNWNADGDSLYGETTDNVDLYPDIYVGRAPVNTPAQAALFVNKILTYEQNPPTGYLTNALMIAYWLDSSTNEAVLKDYIDNNYLSDYLVTKDYEPNFGDGIPKSTVKNHLNQGQGLVNHASHSNYQTTPPLSYIDVDTLNNGNKLFIFYSMGCSTNKFDYADAISENYILNANGGAVAYIGNSRYGWYTPGSPGGGPSDLFDKDFFKQLLANDYTNIGETLAISKQTYIPYSGSNGAYRWIQYCLNLLGDPQMHIWTQEPGPILSYDPESVDLGEVARGKYTASFDIWNGGTETLNWTLSDTHPWLTYTPTYGNSTGEHDQITVTINTSGLLGYYTGIISISSDAGDGYFIVTFYVPPEYTFTCELYSGWNMITLPLENGYTAESLGQCIPSCSLVAGFDGMTQSFNIHVVDSPWDDFPIENGKGYYVYLGEDCIVDFMGYPFTDAEVPLFIGWNLIGWHDESITTAESLGQTIFGCTMVTMLDGQTQSFITHIVGVPHNDFPVLQGMGIYVYVTQGSTWLGG